jgi:hypothetical protein
MTTTKKPHTAPERVGPRHSAAILGCVVEPSQRTEALCRYLRAKSVAGPSTHVSDKRTYQELGLASAILSDRLAGLSSRKLRQASESLMETSE